VLPGANMMDMLGCGDDKVAAKMCCPQGKKFLRKEPEK